MANELQITIRDGAHGKLAIINGKTYSLLRYYESRAWMACSSSPWRGGPRSSPMTWPSTGGCSAAGTSTWRCNARPFSYQLIQGDNTPTDAPHWPKLKSPAPYYAFVGPTEEAARTLIRLTLERYHAKLDADQAMAWVNEVPDLCGGPPAYLLKASRL